MINILHVSQFGMGVGGTEECIYNLCKYIDRNNFSSYIWSPFGGGENLDLLKKEGLIDGFLLSIDPLELSKFLEKIDLVLIHSGATNSLYVMPLILLFKEGTNIPIIEVMHRALPSWGAPYGIDRIVTVSKYVSEKQLPQFSNIIRLIYNGINLESFKPASNEEKIRCRKQLGIPESAFVIGFLGHFAGGKRPQDVVEVANKLRSQTNAYFIIAGDGPNKPAIEKKVLELNLNNMKFAGKIAKSQREDFYSALDLFLFPIEEEAFGLVVCEAMAMGLPVISYNYGPMLEIFFEDKNAYYLAPYKDTRKIAEILDQIINNSNERGRLGRENLKYVKKFDVKKMVEEYMKLFYEFSNQKTRAVEINPASIHHHLGVIALLKK